MSPQYSIPSFRSAGISVQEKNFKIDFNDGHHLGFPICTILAIFNLTLSAGLPMKVSSQLAFQLRRRITKIIFKIASLAAILDFLLEPFKYCYGLLPTDYRPALCYSGTSDPLCYSCVRQAGRVVTPSDTTGK